MSAQQTYPHSRKFRVLEHYIIFFQLDYLLLDIISYNIFLTAEFYLRIFFFTEVLELLFHLSLKKERKTKIPQDLSLQMTNSMLLLTPLSQNKRTRKN